MNLPNQLTVARFGLTMLFIVLASIPAEATVNHWHWQVGFVIAMLAGATDFLDGYLARKYNLITDFGKLMDPLADKIFAVSCFVVLVEHGIVPAWVAILILTREFAVTGLRTMAANKGLVMAAHWMGKLKTVLQMLVLAVGGAIWVSWLPPQGLWWDVLLWTIAAVTVYTGIDYYYRGRNLYIEEI